MPARLRTRLKEAPSNFRATRDVKLSASHVAATALLQQKTDQVHAESAFRGCKQCQIVSKIQTVDPAASHDDTRVDSAVMQC